MDWVQNIGLGLGAASLGCLAILWWTGPLVPWRRARKITRDARHANRDRRDGWS